MLQIIFLSTNDKNIIYKNEKSNSFDMFLKSILQRHLYNEFEPSNVDRTNFVEFPPNNRGTSLV